MESFNLVTEPPTLLPASLLNLVCHANPHQPVVGLELLQRLCAVIDERKTSALATTVLCPEAENGDLVLACFVELRELGAKLVLGDIRAARMEDITADESLERRE